MPHMPERWSPFDAGRSSRWPLPNGVRNAFAVAGGLGVAVLAPALANASSAKPTRPKSAAAGVEHNAFTAATSERPGELAQLLTPSGEGIVAASAAMNAANLAIRGSCAAGSAYSLWLDAPTALARQKCDGSPGTSTPQDPGSDPQTRFQAKLNNIGSQVITSIPGLGQYKLKQDTVNAAGTAGQNFAVNYVCPPESSSAAPSSIEAVQIAADGQASIKQCPADESLAIKPGQLANRITQYYGTQIINGGSAAAGILDIPNKIVVRPHYYERTGKCQLNPANPNANDVQLVRDTRRGDFEITCKKVNGKYKTDFLPSRGANTIAGRQNDFRPALEQAGQQAADSAGMLPNEHGKPSQVQIDFNSRKHTAVADILYNRGNTAGVRQLRELKLSLAKNGTETVQTSFYN